MSREPIESFLDELRVRLEGKGPGVERFLEEARDHLTEARERLRAGGLSGEEASREAIRQFGTADEVTRAFDRSWPHERVLPRKVALGLVLACALLTTFVHGVILAQSLFTGEIREASRPLLVMKVSLAAFVVWMGAATLAAGLGNRALGGASLMGILMALAGAGSVPVVLWLGWTTGDFELWLVAVAAVQVAQGLLTAYVFGSRAGAVPKAPIGT